MTDKDLKSNTPLDLMLRNIAQTLKSEFGDLSASEIFKTVVRIEIRVPETPILPSRSGMTPQEKEIFSNLLFAAEALKHVVDCQPRCAPLLHPSTKEPVLGSDCYLRWAGDIAAAVALFDTYFPDHAPQGSGAEPHPG